MFTEGFKKKSSKAVADAHFEKATEVNKHLLHELFGPGIAKFKNPKMRALCAKLCLKSGASK